MAHSHFSVASGEIRFSSASRQLRWYFICFGGVHTGVLFPLGLRFWFDPSLRSNCSVHLVLFLCIVTAGVLFGTAVMNCLSCVEYTLASLRLAISARPFAEVILANDFTQLVCPYKTSSVTLQFSVNSSFSAFCVTSAFSSGWWCVLRALHCTLVVVLCLSLPWQQIGGRHLRRHRSSLMPLQAFLQ